MEEYEFEVTGEGTAIIYCNAKYWNKEKHDDAFYSGFSYSDKRWIINCEPKNGSNSNPDLTAAKIGEGDCIMFNNPLTGSSFQGKIKKESEKDPYTGLEYNCLSVYPRSTSKPAVDTGVNSVSIPRVVGGAGTEYYDFYIMKTSPYTGTRKWGPYYGFIIDEIADHAFVNCTNLDEVEMGQGIKVVGQNAFKGCDNILTVTMNTTTPPTVYSNSFPDVVYENATLWLPSSEAKSNYNNYTGWRKFKNVKITGIDQKDVNPTSINLPQTLSLTMGEQTTLTPELFPSNSKKGVTWISSNENIVKVEKSGTKAIVKAIKDGRATIWAFASNVYAYCDVTVGQVEITGIEVNPSTQTIREGRTFTLSWKPIPSNATTTVTWRSLHPSVATVNESTGEVTAVSVGTATIRAISANGKTGDCFVTVNGLPKGPVKMVSAGMYHTLILKNDGTVWACGNNSVGQLGDGTEENKLEFVKVMDNVVSIAAGDRQSFFIKEDGTLWQSGFEFWEQADNGRIWAKNARIFTFPEKIMDNVKSVTASYCHTLIVKKDGTLWGLGVNANGQLGDGTTIDKQSPFRITDNVMQAAAGGYHSLVLKKDGTLWACGRNEEGQLGDGTNIERHELVRIKNLSNVTALVDHCYVASYAIMEDGTLWGWGHNLFGQLGDGTTINRNTPQQVMSDIKTASANSCLQALKKDGTLWGVGYNKWGQLGNNSTQNASWPIKVDDDVFSVSAWAHTMIVKKDGSLWACGRNEEGQLGDGTTTNRLTPVKIMEGSTNTAIDDVVIQPQEARSACPVYSLSGQRLSAPRKGINIMNGKIVVVK